MTSWNVRDDDVAADKLPPAPRLWMTARWEVNRCGVVSRRGFLCSRPGSHSGRHASYALGRVIAVWHR